MRRTGGAGRPSRQDWVLANNRADSDRATNSPLHSLRVHVEEEDPDNNAEPGLVAGNAKAGRVHVRPERVRVVVRRNILDVVDIVVLVVVLNPLARPEHGHDHLGLGRGEEDLRALAIPKPSLARRLLWLVLLPWPSSVRTRAMC